MNSQIKVIFLLFLTSMKTNLYSDCNEYFNIQYDKFQKSNTYQLTKTLKIKTDNLYLELQPDMDNPFVIPAIKLSILPINKNVSNMTWCMGIIFLFEDESTYKLIDYSPNNFIDLNKWGHGECHFSYINANTCCNTSQNSELIKLDKEFYNNLSKKRINAIRFINLNGVNDNFDYELTENQKDYFINIYTCYRKKRFSDY